MTAPAPAAVVAAAEHERQLKLTAASILSRVLQLAVSDQTEVLALVVATWVYARDHARKARA